jgi:hypothetical protein
MTPRKITTFRIDEELLVALRQIQERDGVPVPEQVRRAIRTWVEQRGVAAKADRRRAVTRKRP